MNKFVIATLLIASNASAEPLESNLVPKLGVISASCVGIMSAMSVRAEDTYRRTGDEGAHKTQINSDKLAKKFAGVLTKIDLTGVDADGAMANGVSVVQTEGASSTRVLEAYKACVSAAKELY